MTPETVAQWLTEIGLPQYRELFDQHRIGLDVIPDLTDLDLHDLGIPLGDRKRFLKAIPALAQASLAAQPRPVRAPEAERRQLTVMFCDLVGSTELSQRLDPEELRRLIRRYQDACVGAITRFEGFVAQYLGDGVLAYFGYPIALEAGVERAIRAALSVIDQVAKMSSPNEQVLRVRIGIDTGLVVIGQGEALSEQERTAVGDAPNIAARLQALASPNTVVISARARQLAGDSFHYEDLGGYDLKGVPESVHAWRVTGERTSETRFDTASGGIASPMIGRQIELDTALRTWQQVKARKLHVLLLCGEPGIGKSRVMRALRDHCVADGGQVWQYQCSPYFSNSALYPILMHIERSLRFARDETVEARLDKLEAMINGQFGRPALDVNLLGRLFGLPVETRYGALDMSPQKQKEESLRALNDLVQTACARAPLLMLFEDVHWADPTTVEAIDQTLRRADMPALIVLTYRPEFKPPWIGQANVTALTLGRLDADQIEAVATRVAGKPLPKEIIGQIVAKTDGVPLFVEELTKTILELSLIRDVGDRYVLAGPLPALAVPSSLRDSLTARLDRLAPLKEIAQIGACIGREFSDELLALIAPLPRTELDNVIFALIASELVSRRGTGKDAVYVFKHALVQDAAYDSLLKSKRAEVHLRIARALEQHFGQSVSFEPELLAHHYTEAGMSDQAVPYWLKAGQQALDRMALSEAIADLDKGLAQAGHLSTETLRESLELELRTLLGTAWMALGGWFHPKVNEHLQVAWPLARSLQRHDLMSPILWGLAMHTATKGRMKESLRWVEEALGMAAKLEDNNLAVVAHMIAMVCLFWYGDLRDAKRHVDWVLGNYEPVKHLRIAQLTNHDPKTVALIYEVNLLWVLGYPDRARAASILLDQQTESRKHYFDQGFAWTLGGWAYLYRGEAEEQGRFLDKAYRVGIDQGLPFFSHAQVPFHRGYHFALLGKYEDAVTASRDSCSVWQSLGAGIAIPHAMAYWAEAEGRVGRAAEGLHVVAQALEQIDRPGWEERGHLAEVLRVQGWLYQQLGETARAEESLLASLRWAREQQAKGWELRSAITLARLWESTDRRVEARELLQPVYGWFSEGFDTKDLKEAEALLSSLS